MCFPNANCVCKRIENTEDDWITDCGFTFSIDIYSEDDDSLEFLKNGFCPFCGKRRTLVISEEEDDD